MDAAHHRGRKVIGVASLLVAMFVLVACAARRYPVARSAHRMPATRSGNTDGSADPGRAPTARATTWLAHHSASRWLAIGAATLTAALLFGPLLALAGTLGVVLLRRCRPLLADRRRQLLIGRAVPDAIELFVLAVYAGLSPIQAVHELAIAAPQIVRGGFVSVVHRLDRGEPFGLALQALPDQLGVGMVGLADVVASADRYGLPLGPVLESLALEARSSRRRSDEADARRLPVRLAFPLVACTLPSFVLLAIAPAVLAALSSLDLSS